MFFFFVKLSGLFAGWLLAVVACLCAVFPPFHSAIKSLWSKMTKLPRYAQVMLGIVGLVWLGFYGANEFNEQWKGYNASRQLSLKERARIMANQLKLIADRWTEDKYSREQMESAFWTEINSRFGNRVYDLLRELDTAGQHSGLADSIVKQMNSDVAPETLWKLSSEIRRMADNLQ